MYVFPAGSGCTGVPTLVQPGDESIFGQKTVENKDISIEESGIIASDIFGSGQFSGKSSQSQRLFHSPMKQEELEKLSHKNFAPETLKKIKWATNMYRDWRNFRHANGFERIECDLDNKESITLENLVFALVRFLTEVKKLDGTDFPGKTLYDILICVQFHLDTLGFNWKLLNQEIFSDVRFTLDNLMKIRVSQGLGISVKKAQVLSISDEDYLWSIGLLGTDEPNQLINTLVLIIGKGFTLRAGKEHQVLRAPPFNSQFTFMHDCEGCVFIRYNEDIGLKTNKGGIKQRKIEPKEVDVFAIENQTHCPVRIFLKYLSLLPPNRNCKSFYLQPKKKK